MDSVRRNDESRAPEKKGAEMCGIPMDCMKMHAGSLLGLASAFEAFHSLRSVGKRS